MISEAAWFGKLLSDKGSEGTKRDLTRCLPGWTEGDFLSQDCINFRNVARGKERCVCTRKAHRGVASWVNLLSSGQGERTILPSPDGWLFAWPQGFKPTGIPRALAGACRAPITDAPRPLSHLQEATLPAGFSQPVSGSCKDPRTAPGANPGSHTSWKLPQSAQEFSYPAFPPCLQRRVRLAFHLTGSQPFVLPPDFFSHRPLPEDLKKKKKILV